MSPINQSTNTPINFPFSIMSTLLDLFLHLDTHLASIIAQFGLFTYIILFLIIFCETGLVVAPFLPGDSLLFAAGAFAARGSFDPLILFLLLSVAAILGDTVNYAIGAYLGPKVFRENVRFLNKDHLMQAELFYEKHGKKTIVLARFLPIIRTLAPFVAGIGRMHYGSFLAYNIGGGILWVALFVFGGYFFGTIPAVEENFTLVIMGIIVVSVLPGVVHYFRQHWRKRKVTPSSPATPSSPSTSPSR